MRKSKDIIIFQKASLNEALKKLEKTRTKLLICVDNKKKFVGVVSDGDIRRKLINKKIDLESKIGNLININASTINENSPISIAQSLLSSRVTILPVLNSYQQVVGYYAFEDLIKNYERKISIIGLGYVGLTLALCMSKNGFEITGFDTNKQVIKNLKKGNSHFYEHKLDYLLKNEKKKINFSYLISQSKSDCYILSVGTPIKNRKPNLKHITEAIKQICTILKEGDLIILRSTLPIKTTDDVIIPLIYKIKKFKPGIDYFISFAPERTVEGNAIYELENNPQIIGANDLVSFEKTSKIFNNITKSIIKVEDIKSAEFAKLVDNSYRDHKFAFSNQLIEPCEKLKINLSSVIKAVNFGYGRNDIAKPSPGVGGPCLSKDPYIFFNSLKTNDNKSILKKVRNINENIPKYVYSKVLKLIKSVKINKKDIKIFFLGLAFKGYPETSDVRYSTSIQVIKCFSKFKNIYCYDPVLKVNEIKKLGLKYSNISSGFKNADVIIFLNNHKSFEMLNIEELLKKTKKPSILVDTWNILDEMKIKQLKSVYYSGLGNERI